MITPTEFDPQTIVEVLQCHHVDYVLLGGYAAKLHGAARPTQDIDVTPATSTENLARLSAALGELEAGIRVNELPEGLPFDTSAEALRGIKMLNLRSPHGDLDLTFEPAGFPHGYDDLIGQARAREVGGVTVQLAALADVIASKTAAGRRKDIEALPELIDLAASQQRDTTAVDTGIDAGPAAAPHLQTPEPTTYDPPSIDPGSLLT